MPSRSLRTLFAGLAIALQVGLAARRASADEPAHSLRDAIRVEPGATCLDAATLVEHVASWVGTQAVDGRIVVDVRGSPDQPRVVGFQMVRDGRVVAVRTFDPGPSRCEQLHAVLGLAIAMALNASLIDQVAPATLPSAAPALPLATAAVTREPLGWSVTASAISGLAVLPDPAFGGELRIERALTPTFQVRLGALALLASGETFDGVPGHFDEWLLAPRADLCAGLDVTRRIRARGCMGVAGGALHASGSSYPTSQSTFIRWLVAANELGATAELGRRWSIDAGVTLVLPLARNSIVLRDYAGNVLEQRDLAPVGWLLAVGPRLAF